MAESEQQKRDLIKQRGVVKGKLTAFSNHVKKVLENQSLCETDIINLEERLTRVIDLLTDFDTFQTRLELITPDDELDIHITARTEFEDLFYSSISDAKKVISGFNSNLIASVESGSSVSNHSVDEQQLHGIRLPVINLPTFDSSIDTWLEYRDTFQSLIHENSTINNIQKFHYLRASLQGEAAQVIHALELSAANYEVAWGTLCERYNNTSLLIHTHTKSLFNLENIQKESSSKLRVLIDSVTKHLRSLAQLQQPVESWDTLIIYLVTSKLDLATNRAWEQRKSANSLPTWDDLKQFLRDRANMLETLSAKSADKVTNLKKDSVIKTKGFHAIVKCGFCQKDHSIYSCTEFTKLSINDRIEQVRKAKLCNNCLQPGHFIKSCRSGSCKRCHRRHNTLLHLETSADSGKVDTVNSSNQPNVSLTASTNNIDQVLLSTVLITVVDSFNNGHTVRALLDSGSQSSFVTSSLVENLHLDKLKTNIKICGLNHTLTDTQCKCDINIKSQNSNFITNVSCLVIPQITSNLPNTKLDKCTINIPSNLKLADPSFNIPGKVDILLGADVFWKSLCVGQIHLGPTKPVLQKTRFGWLVSGQVGNARSKRVQCHFSSNLDLEIQLAKFWALEECPQNTKSVSIEEEACEKHFIENTKRSEDGRFIVSLPLKKPSDCLGESLAQAQKRFFSLERKLQNNPVFREQYNNFMAEYERLGHMTLVSECDNKTENKGNKYYMPHHGVIKDSLTTQLRVVFDASASTSTGISLNDIQMTGPTIQDDLLSIILRFRVHKYVVSADIAKMYRQVVINSDQRFLQCILWRSSPLEPLKTYTLNTVTYGHTSAPFLAIRCLFELAKECESSVPEIADVIRHSFYVDDLLFSTDSTERASHICKNLNMVLSKGCFQLRKWFSNEPKILKDISNTDISHNVLNFGSDQNAKTLGLIWNSKFDKLMFHIDTSSKYKTISKRSILSQISTIFDPLGLLAACTIIAKLLIQKLWLEKLSWDESLPTNLHHSWLTFKDQLPELNSLEVSRQVVCESSISIELHGFSDASQLAYGGCVYVKSINAKGEVFVHLVLAKSKVAPLKVQTLPRLELCGAAVLAKLINKVLISLNLNLSRVVLWTDSTIVLGWIKTDSHLLKTFVSNRVAEIQRLTSSFEWRHVPSKSNPADLLSRGVPPGQIQGEILWWFGPDFLKHPEHEWPVLFDNNIRNLPDMRNKPSTTLVAATHRDVFPFEKYSNLLRLKRIVAYIMRFKYNSLHSKSDRRTGQLTHIEIEDAFLLLIKLSQTESFSDEMIDLKRGKNVSTKSKCYSLNPFVDKNGLIRVGGRLSNTNYEFDKKHPYLLSSKHKLTKMIFISEHQRLFHVGSQSLLASIRERFWPISGKNLAKAVTRGCVKCFRFNAKVTKPIMGDLPSSRLIAETPFYITGVDYAGPFLIRNHKGRGSKLSKCYVCLFICFATKAVHLELVSSLSSEAFILSLRRFTSRRGKPVRIYSDNGLNFVRSNKELQILGDYLVSQKEVLQDSFSKEGIDWRFIPVNSPHFGGLWESGVKSVKHHLKRVMGTASLTFEEFYSLLLQIEAILNSRPISPLSSDPNDLTPLTPAHFLIGKTLTSIPDPNLEHIPETRLSHHQKIQMLRQHFWKRWSREYVSELQQRQRWKATQSQLNLGDLVIVKEDNVPPVYWKLGRVIELHSGKDSVCRVASVKCATGTIKRAFSKLCPLPVNA